MATADKLSRVDLGFEGELKLTVAGGEDSDERIVFDVSQCVVTFALDTIPTARCMVPVGVNMRDFSKVAPDPFSGPTLDKPEVWLELFQKVTDRQGSRAERGYLFAGRATGRGAIQGYGTFQPTIDMVHRLHDLTSASTLSPVSHPANPFDLTYSILHQPTGAGSDLGYNIAAHVGREVLETELRVNVWHAIRNFLIEVAKRDDLLENECAGAPTEKGNERVVELLERIGGDFRVRAGEASDLVAEAMADFINSTQVEGYASMTFWDLIVGRLAPELMFKVAPHALGAEVIAYTPGYRKPWKVIPRDEVAEFHYTGQTPKSVRAVGIIGQLQSETGLPYGADPVSQSVPGLVGCYAPEGRSGVVMYHYPPGWLARLPVSEEYVADSLALYDDSLALSTTSTPAAAPAPRARQPGDRLTEARDVFDRYAHSVFIHEQLRGRFGRVVCPLRLDICPGSPVVVETLTGPVRGDVVAVTLAISAEGRHASTTLELANIYYPDREAESIYAVDEHPLYGDEAFGGGELVYTRKPD